MFRNTSPRLNVSLRHHASVTPDLWRCGFSKKMRGAVRMPAEDSAETLQRC
jgi:hypothetical protein